jgi:hypothetical protein
MPKHKKKEEIKPPHHDIYLGSSSSWERARKQQQKDAFAWKVGFFAMTIISIVGIYAIYWAATL